MDYLGQSVLPDWLAIALSAVALFACVRYRFGPEPKGAGQLLTQLRQPNSGRIVGNLLTAGLPAAGSMLAIIVGLRVGGEGAGPWILLGLVLGLVAVWFAWSPPVWAKASWLRDGETSGRWPIPNRTGWDVIMIALVGSSTLIVLVVVLAVVLRPFVE